MYMLAMLNGVLPGYFKEFAVLDQPTGSLIMWQLSQVEYIMRASDHGLNVNSLHLHSTVNKDTSNVYNLALK